MNVKKISLLLAVPVLALGACSKDAPGDSAKAAGDTAVHTAEAAVATVDELMAKGERVYNANCAACHQPNGKGLTGAFPPLANSDYLEGDRKKVMTAALFGLSGPITVNGVEYNGVMPSMGYLPDEDLAAVLTYVFKSWGNDGAAVSVGEVAALRAELGKSDRAEGQRHQGATEGELKYQGAPSAISAEETRQIMAAGGPVLERGRIWHATQTVFRALRRLPRRAAQGRDRQAADARHHQAERHGVPESPDQLWLAGRHAELGHFGRTDRRSRSISWRASCSRSRRQPPEFGMPEMKASWKVLVAGGQRPKKPAAQAQHRQLSFR